MSRRVSRCVDHALIRVFTALKKSSKLHPDCLSSFLLSSPIYPLPTPTVSIVHTHLRPTTVHTLSLHTSQETDVLQHEVRILEEDRGRLMREVALKTELEGG